MARGLPRWRVRQALASRVYSDAKRSRTRRRCSPTLEAAIVPSFQSVRRSRLPPAGKLANPADDQVAASIMFPSLGGGSGSTNSCPPLGRPPQPHPLHPVGRTRVIRPDLLPQGSRIRRRPPHALLGADSSTSDAPTGSSRTPRRHLHATQGQPGGRRAPSPSVSNCSARRRRFVLALNKTIPQRGKPDGPGPVGTGSPG